MESMNSTISRASPAAIIICSLWCFDGINLSSRRKRTNTLQVRMESRPVGEEGMGSKCAEGIISTINRVALIIIVPMALTKERL